MMQWEIKRLNCEEIDVYKECQFINLATVQKV